MGDEGGSSSSSQNSSRDECDRSVPGAHPYEATTKQYYDMTKNRLMFIFNHDEYQNTKHFGWEPPTSREGTAMDVEKLTKTFSELGFEVDDKNCNNLTHDAIMDKLEEICAMDHTDTSCLAITILTHGAAGGRLCAADKMYPLSDVINYIVNEKRLAGKPKLFFIQACRGRNVDKGHRLQFDGRAGYTIPTHADCLVLMSSYDGLVSFRETNGTWMIQSLCEVLNETRDQDFHILDVITLVNDRVAGMISWSLKQEYHEKKQIPETKFTLRKFLKF